MRVPSAFLVGLLMVSAASVATGSAALVASAEPTHVSMGLPISFSKVTSQNWAGYAVNGATFNDVQGTWTQPAVVGSCTSAARYASFWVGIDGYSSTTVEQIGTDSDCTGGHASYYAWYEMFPANSVTISSLTIHPGDVLTAQVKVSGTSFTLSLKDATSKQSFSIKKTSASATKSSAEWIAESPEICSTTCSLAKLNNFGTVHFTNCEAATGAGLLPISSFTGSSGPHEITMTNSAHTKDRAVPSALGSTGKSFSITWKSY